MLCCGTREENNEIVPLVISPDITDGPEDLK